MPIFRRFDTMWLCGLLQVILRATPGPGRDGPYQKSKSRTIVSHGAASRRAMVGIGCLLDTVLEVLEKLQRLNRGRGVQVDVAQRAAEIVVRRGGRVSHEEVHLVPPVGGMYPF